MTTDSTNPFVSPTTGEEPQHVDDAGLTKPQRKRLEVGEVVVAWEKRRLWYNLALAITTVVMAMLILLAGATDWLLASPEHTLNRLTELLILALAANACYFAGPIVEGYWTWFFGPSGWLRNTLFLLGTLFAILLAVLFVIVAAYPPF